MEYEISRSFYHKFRKGKRKWTSYGPHIATTAKHFMIDMPLTYHQAVPKLTGLLTYLMHKYPHLQHQALRELQSQSQVHNVLLMIEQLTKLIAKLRLEQMNNH